MGHVNRATHAEDHYGEAVFAEIMEAFECVVRNRKENIMFCAHNMIKDMPELNNYVVYNSEQVTPFSSWVNWKSYIDILKNHESWDYSMTNVETLKAYGVKAKFVPVRYMPCMTKFRSLDTDKQDIDVLFYGGVCKRRHEILQKLLKAGVNVQHLFGAFGVKRDAYIAHSKIILNLHQFKEGIFEIFRCSHLFANSKCVVSEKGRDKTLDDMYAKSTVFCETDEIVDTCLKYLKDDDLRVAQERQAFEAFKSPTLLDSLK